MALSAINVSGDKVPRDACEGCCPAKAPYRPLLSRIELPDSYHACAGGDIVGVGKVGALKIGITVETGKATSKQPAS